MIDPQTWPCAPEKLPRRPSCGAVGLAAPDLRIGTVRHAGAPVGDHAPRSVVLDALGNGAAVGAPGQRGPLRHDRLVDRVFAHVPGGVLRDPEAADAQLARYSKDVNPEPKSSWSTGEPWNRTPRRQDTPAIPPRPSPDRSRFGSGGTLFADIRPRFMLEARIGQVGADGCRR